MNTLTLRTGHGVQVDLGEGALEIVEFSRQEGVGQGVAFPITEFGTYLVALERDR